MRRRRALVSILALLIIGAGGSFALPSEPGPLPTLANGGSWATALADGRPGAHDDRVWLESGTVPGRAAHHEVVERALLDLRALTRPDGAVAAGPSGPWAYAWPRDNSFVAVAYAVTGHAEDAWRVLRFFVRAQLDDGGFEARYTLDGPGVPDNRPRQADGAGWLLWAIDAVRSASGDPVPADLRSLRDRAIQHVLDLTDDGVRLPPPSPDYWEVPERRVTLGTVAPLAAGLEASARSRAAEGDVVQARHISRAAAALRSLIGERFGPTYQRHGDRGGLDAGAAMLLPPFADAADPAVLAAVRGYAEQALRPAGGLAPGVAWKSDGVSWTPETALVAYTAAVSGDRTLATRWRDWLAAHATSWGSLPEKVLPDGRPAGPAPLAWTAALFVLIEAELAAL
ncbi:glycoside hydrolase family 15 [Intrasporangium calvum]|uniref:Glycoside hydrolase 15-related protein n=1 Tax=Intrasporangium calvum (strain ATCC 23552 / DSM 43043 / JCM 3097 / NBRC 12989 / NCIMB 10167 / NRRL B-3866 / 7 KIP) TaxID=710696 RepID=E6S6D0_INTC7|nr:glycoside hydrolase family 15 [Intrasporangium calvum]ADU48919.1 glycoside hydrolase 15-related protein [Intrasporangium calvum DSM 43043]